MALPSRDELLKRMRKKREERNATRRDPDEFRVPKMATGAPKLTYYFRVLPELSVGDKCHNEETCETPSDLWYYENGNHWWNKKKYECPRIHDGNECALCSLGFDLLEDESDKDMRSEISKKYLARSMFGVNVYFLNTKSNPEEVRGKVMWYNLPLTLWKPMDECITNDDPGDEVDPKACGIFYHPYEGGYTFKLEAVEKGGWNNYEKSGFLPKSFGPLIANKDGSANDAAIQAVLDQRFIVQNKFPKRDSDVLADIVKNIEKQEAGGDNDDDIEEIAEAKKTIKEAPKAKAKDEKTVKAAAADRRLEATEDDIEDVIEDVVEDEEIKEEPTKVKTKVETKAEIEDDPELADLLGAIKAGKKK